MKSAVTALAVASALFAGQALANADLAKKNNCLACHTVDKAVVGPAYQDVAKKYAGDKVAEARLVEKVKKGGVGVWGTVPMPPNGTVKDEEIKALVKWILAGAK
jgi:cytochrome c